MIKCIVFRSGYFDYDDDLTEVKGHRSDIHVCMDDDKCFNLNFISIERLNIEFAANLERGEIFFADEGLVIVNTVNKDSIIRSIVDLYNKKFFSTQKNQVIEPSDGWVAFDISGYKMDE